MDTIDDKLNYLVNKTTEKAYINTNQIYNSTSAWNQSTANVNFTPNKSGRFLLHVDGGWADGCVLNSIHINGIEIPYTKFTQTYHFFAVADVILEDTDIITCNVNHCYCRVILFETVAN